MNFHDLKDKLDDYKKKLVEKSGKMVVWGKGGPATVELVEAAYEAIVTTNGRIAALEKRLEKLEKK